MRSRRCGALAAALVLAAPAGAGACSATTTPDPRVATWRAVNGFALGAREATDEQVDRYLRALDRTSRRVRVRRAGRSSEGRPLLYAVAGEPLRLAPQALARLAARARAVRDGRSSPGRARAFAAHDPLFAWVGGGVHGNEPSGADADMRLLYDLAAGRTCRDQARLRRLVTFVLPLQNPDGRAAGARDSAAGFDLNRDWFAATQPETRAKLALLERYPPAVFADQHEESGTGFFFPPNADPIHHEISAQALNAIDDVIAPALRRAFRGAGVGFVNYETFDLFFMGYGDSVPTTLFGAAGMTFEQGGESPYAERVGHHFLAADAALDAAAAHRRRLLSGWAAQWRQAAAQGARGELQPNRVVEPGDSVRFAVPAARVYGYAVRTDVHAADALALAHRLAAVGVRVLRLTRPLAVGSLAPYGRAAAGPATLPAGTLVVSSAQPAKHWVEAMLGPDPYVPFPYFYDVCSWSNPLLMGLEGGAVQTPLALPAGAAQPVSAAARPAEPAPGPAGYGFAGDSEGAAEMAMALLARGTPVSRAPDGSYATGGTAGVTATASSRRVELRGLDSLPARAAALRRPRVALLGDTGEDGGPGDLSAAWARWLLDRRYGVKAASVTAADLAAGALSSYDVLLVPDGTTSPAQISPLALTRLQAWVRGGGTLVGWRGRGQAIAQAAGVTAVRAVAAPDEFQVPGAELRVVLAPADPVARGEQPQGFVFNTGDPILAAHGAPVVATYPSGAGFYVSGYTTGTSALRGTAAATDEVVGAGRVVLFAFDPAFRGYVEGTERLLANALLAPPPGGAAARRARPAEPIDPDGLALAPAPQRDATVRVALGDLPALLHAARAAGLRGSLRIERDLSTATLRVPNPRGLAPEDRPWTLRLPSALAARGVRPLLAVL